jgi:VCBS repeat-containing protein
VSNITFASINENFPVAGQDNDTQTFRDNFDSIKTALSTAKTEITDLQDNVVRLDTDNDLNGSIIQNARLQNNYDVVLEGQVFDAGLTTFTIDFSNGNYQIFTLSNSSMTFDFLNFPTDGSKLGKVTIELYSLDGNPKTVNFSLSGSGAAAIKKNGFSLPITVTSQTNPTILEIWRHGYARSTVGSASTDNFYINNLGIFS